MFRFLALLACCAGLCCGCLPAPAQASGCAVGARKVVVVNNRGYNQVHGSRVVVNAYNQVNDGFAVVPFAVPVAVPVAVVQPTLALYGYNHGQAAALGLGYGAAVGYAQGNYNWDGQVQARAACPPAHPVGGGSQWRAPPGPPAPAPQPAPQPAPAPEPPVGGGEEWREGAATVSGSVQSRVQALFSARCGSCHSAVNKKGDLALFSADGILLPQDRQLVRDEILSDKMPKGGPALTEDEKKLVIEYALTPPGVKW
jgi:hypothetical protein